MSENKEWDNLIKLDWEEHFIKLSTGINLCYMTMGNEKSEKTIILIHGATDSRLTFIYIAPKLAKLGYKIYIPELRGHGKSDKPKAKNNEYTLEEYTLDIKDFITKLNITNFSISGHSLGSFISLRISTLFKVNKCILLGSALNGSNSEGLEIYFKGYDDFKGIHGYDDTKIYPDSFLRNWCNCDDKLLSDAIYIQCKELKYDVITYIFDGLKTLDNSNFVDKVKCDVCVVWGDKDGCFIKKDQDELIKGLVNASKVKFEVIQGCPHNMCVNKEFCDKTVEIIDHFVNE